MNAQVEGLLDRLPAAPRSLSALEDWTYYCGFNSGVVSRYVVINRVDFRFIRPRPTKDTVVLLTVVACPCIDVVIAVAAKHAIDASATDDGVVFVTAIDVVVACFAVYGVVVPAAIKRVV